MSNEVNIDEIRPESLMDSFRGPGLSKMLMVTLAVHVVVILGSSVPFLLRSVLGEDRGELSKEERIERAVADATGELQKIAREHGLSAKEITDQFAKGPSAPPVVSAPPEVESVAPESPSNTAPAEPKSAIEQELEKKATGPALPDVSSDINGGEPEEDLFK